jgi:hypothetical protein
MRTRCAMRVVHDPSVAAYLQSCQSANSAFFFWNSSSTPLYTHLQVTPEYNLNARYQHVSDAMYPPFDYFEHRRAW